MDQTEYIAVLWRVIYALGGIAIALIGVVVAQIRHEIRCRATRDEVASLKRKINRGER